MTVRRTSIYVICLLFVAMLCFGLGSYSSEVQNERVLADRDAKLDALRSDMNRALAQLREGQMPRPSATSGTTTHDADVRTTSGRNAMVDQIKRELQAEMGLMPVHLLRERRQSFVELYSYDNHGHSNYGTAGYIGNGYFVTVKHAVIALPVDDDHKITSVKVSYRGQLIPATIVDAGNAEAEVDLGDWAILKVAGHIDLPPLRVNANFPYEFADPIFRLGNDYSKGIILSTGYVGQRTSNGLVTCLTDGHPGVSGGGVLDQQGEFVGIPIGRMQGDYRFSFILPLRREMFRKVSLPKLAPDPASTTVVAAAQ
ncbi:MAG: S1 family peptidase [Bacteroidales bacterium]